MKKKLCLLGVSVLVLLVFFAACDNGPGQGDKVFSISGKFNKGGDDVSFSLVEASPYNKSAKSAARAAYDQSIELAGELNDDDLTFRLKGSLDPVSGVYNVSAAGSFIRYSISGTVDPNTYKSLNATATLLVKTGSGDEWAAYTYPVITDGVNAGFTNTDDTDNSDDEGIPEEFLGYWDIYFDDIDDLLDEGWEISATCLFSPFKYKVELYMADPDGEDSIHFAAEANVISVEEDGSHYDIVSAYPLYIGSESEVAGAVESYLVSKGKTPERIDLEDDWEFWIWLINYDDLPTYAYDLEPLDDGTWDILWIGLIMDEDIDLIIQYYLGDYETLYMIDKGVTPIIQYCRNRIELTNATTMVFTDYGITYEGDFITDVDYLDDVQYLTELDDDPVILRR